MALKYLGLDKGESEFDVTEDSSTTSCDIEVVIDDAAGLERAEVLYKLDQIKNHILKMDWPLA